MHFSLREEAQANFPMAKNQKKERTLSRSTRKKLEALPPKKQRYVANRLRGDSKTQAALAAGYTKSMALKVKDRIETVDVTQALRSALSEMIPIEHLAQRVAEGLDAMKTESYLVSRKGAKQERFSHLDKIAYDERRQYAALATRLLGVKGMSVNVEADEQPKVIVQFDYPVLVTVQVSDREERS